MDPQVQAKFDELSQAIRDAQRGNTNALQQLLQEIQQGNQATAQALQQLNQGQQNAANALQAQTQALTQLLQGQQQGGQQQVQGGQQQGGQQPPALPPATVPSLVDKTPDEAARLLPQGYNITNVTRENSNSVGHGKIIRYTINDKNIEIVVSDGIDPRRAFNSPTQDHDRITPAPGGEHVPHAPGQGAQKKNPLQEFGEGFLKPWTMFKKKDHGG
jgi:hypothetical protein